MQKKLITILTVVSIVSQSLKAQTPADTLPLSLPEAEKIFLQKNKNESKTMSRMLMGQLLKLLT